MNEIILLAGIIAWTIILLTSMVILSRFYLNRLRKSVLTWFLPRTDQSGQPMPSEFADSMTAIAQIFATAITASIKGTILGMNSAAVRQDAAAARELMKTQNPVLGSLLSFLPKGITRTIVKNPELAQLAMQWVANQGKEKVSSNNGGGEVKNPFNL